MQKYYFEERLIQMKPYEDTFHYKYARNANIGDLIEAINELLQLQENDASNQEIQT